MARPRSELSEALHSICPNVHFQPPASKKLTYPCIIYQLDGKDVMFANNGHYRLMDQYSIMYITRDPDDANINGILSLQYCSLTRTFSSDNLHHYAYRIYI
jgi:hypothetical protein